VTLPAIIPALLSATLLVIMLGFALFSVPIIIGTRPRIDVLSVKIFRLLTASFPPKTDVAIVLSLFMLAVIQAALLVQNVVARSGRHAAIGGRGFKGARVQLRGWRWAARGAFLGYLLLTAALPLLAVILVSFEHFWTASVPWSKLTLHNYHYILFDNHLTSTALKNSLGLGVIGATIGMLISAVLALAVHRSPGTGGRLVDGITGLPATVPHTVMGVGFLIAFVRPPFNLHGSLMLLLLAYLVLYLPQSVRSASAAIAQVGRELQEASGVCGAGQARTFLRILLPLMLPGLIAGWVILFVLIVGELTASVLLSGVGNPVVGTVILSLWENGTFPQLAALAVLISLLNTVVVLGLLHFSRGTFASRIS